MAENFSFTKVRIENIIPPARGRLTFHDEGCDNLILVVSPASRIFYYYGRLQGRPTRLALGRFPRTTVDQARQACARMAGANAEGRDPAAERAARRQEPTLRILFDHWLEVHGRPRKRPKSLAEDQRMFEYYLKEWHNRKLSSIRHSDVAAWHARVGRDHGPIMANRAKALLHALYEKSRNVGYTGENPCRGVARFPEQSRERFLLPDEMKSFFAALEDENEQWQDFFSLCLYTGSRKGNVQSMLWSELDLSRGVWYLPAEKTKNKRPGVIALVQAAVVILERRRERSNGSIWVFPNKRDTGPIHNTKMAWNRILKRSGIENLHIHDLRRTMGSWQAAMGASLITIGKSLGHVDLKSTAIYSRLQIDGVKESVEKAVDAMRLAGGVQLIESQNEKVQ